MTRLAIALTLAEIAGAAFVVSWLGGSFSEWLVGWSR